MRPNASSDPAAVPDPSDGEVAVAAAKAGADVVRRAYGSAAHRSVTPSDEFTTETDLASEAAILAVLEQHRPHDAREGEETGSSGDLTARRRWLVDPLCGTVNFAATTPLLSVNVALVEGAEALAAACADPIADEVFATDGRTAQLITLAGTAPLAPTADSRIVEVNCDGPLDAPFVGAQLLVDAAIRATWALRVVSTTLAVAWVSAGRRAAYVTDGRLLGDVHFTAGIAVCRDAGCIVTDLAGGPLHAGRGLIVAADEATHAELVTAIRPHLEALERTGSERP
jgi:fructose-1,6-bisphosphatase/inositol monophosphatase family enzyme